MADKTISDLTAATSVAGGDLFEIENAGGNSRKITATNLANGLKTLALRGALVKLSADSASTDFTTATVLGWDSETGGYDTDGIHDNVTNNSRLTVPSGVSYVRLTATIRFTTTLLANNTAGARILKNGSSSYVGAGGNQSESSFSNAAVQVLTGVVAVTPGDYFEARLQTESDTAAALESDESWFQMEILA